MEVSPCYSSSQHRNDLIEETKIISISQGMPMVKIEKPKRSLLGRVLPLVWFIRPRFKQRKPRSLKSPDSEPVVADSAPFLPKVVENCYKRRDTIPRSELRVFTPLKSPPTDTVTGQVSNSTGPETALPSSSPEEPPEGKNEDVTRKLNSTLDITTNTISTCSLFSRCAYKSAFSSLRSLCNVVGDDSLVDKESTSVSFQKTATLNLRAWFLSGCGRGSFSRKRHGSIDLDKESGSIELDVSVVLKSTEDMGEGESSRLKKSESWSGCKLTTWSVELTDDREERWITDPDSPSNQIPILRNLFLKSSKNADARKMYPETEEPSSEDLFSENYDEAPLWNSMSSIGSGSSTFVTPSNFMLDRERKPWINSDSEIMAPYSREFDRGNISDSQSLVRGTVFVEQMQEVPKFLKEHRVPEKQNEEETKKLLVTLDKALDQYNLKRLIVEEESRIGSPKLGLHNSPVFESFLESSAKAWEFDFPPFNVDEDCKTSGSGSDKSRELHCITVQSSAEVDRQRESMQEQVGREEATGMQPNSSLVKPRKAKRSMEKEVPKKRSPSKNPFPKGNREERTNHPQQEESIQLRDGLINTRKKFNETRRRSKQHRLKQLSVVPNAASPPLPEKQHDVVKESVAVVVESSYDPYNDFRESMIEMIIDQDIQEISDLEELLQCYLALNEPEYHSVIVDVFTDLWHELFEGNT